MVVMVDVVVTLLFVEDKNMWTLFHLKFKRHFRAEQGGNGSKSRSTGKDGEDIYIDVPLGTIIRDSRY